MATLNSFIYFNGKTEEAFNFYRSVFGGEFAAFQRYTDMPGNDKVAPEDMDKVLHVALPIDAHTSLFGNDTLDYMGQRHLPGNNFSLSLAAESEAEADRLFNGLSAGGHIVMPLQKMFWGAYFGMFNDKFGISWLINYDYPEE